MFPKTHFHPRGVAKMEKTHFDAGFIGTKIRALAQRGAQNSCPGAISKVLSRCFLLARPGGGEFGPQWPCQGTFAFKCSHKIASKVAQNVMVICLLSAKLYSAPNCLTQRQTVSLSAKLSTQRQTVHSAPNCLTQRRRNAANH